MPLPRRPAGKPVAGRRFPERYPRPHRRGLRDRSRLFDGRPPGLAEPPNALLSSDQRVRIKRDHRTADQSDGGAAGSNGSSYRNTVPRIIPMNGGSFSPGAGTGDNTATGRPRFVIVTDPPSRFISLMMHRHPALNSAGRDLPCCHPFLPVEMPDARSMYRSCVHNAERNQGSQLAREPGPTHPPSARFRALHHGKTPSEAVPGR